MVAVSQATRASGSSRDDRVEDRVGDLVAHLVRVALGHRLGREQVAAARRRCSSSAILFVRGSSVARARSGPASAAAAGPRLRVRLGVRHDGHPHEAGDEHDLRPVREGRLRRLEDERFGGQAERPVEVLLEAPDARDLVAVAQVVGGLDVDRHAQETPPVRAPGGAQDRSGTSPPGRGHRRTSSRPSPGTRTPAGTRPHCRAGRSRASAARRWRGRCRGRGSRPGSDRHRGPAVG